MKPFAPPLARLIPATAFAALVAACAAPPVGLGIELPALTAPAVTGDRAMSATVVEPVVAMETVITAAPEFSGGSRTPRRGVVTAGDIDDGLNLAAFQRYVAGAASRLDMPQVNLGNPVLARITGPDGQSAPGVRITLRRPGATDPFYDGYSGVDGMVTVFPAVLGAGRLSEVELRAFSDGNGAEVVQRLTTGTRTLIHLPEPGDWNPDFLDLVFVLDTTGSMGDELAWLTREMRGIVGTAARAAPGVDIRYGLIVYRDQGDDYVVQNYGFTPSQATMVNWLRGQSAGGGGDYPEAAADALRAGAALDWRRGKGERLMIHIADAPPHSPDARAYLDAARLAALTGVQVYGLGASGVADEAEFLMRQAAAITNGRYMFLTDDSGVGNAHAEPAIACYRVTALTGLLTRVLQSELSGHRVEATGAQVIREVGSYAAGVCRQ